MVRNGYLKSDFQLAGQLEEWIIKWQQKKASVPPRIKR
jgi:hypothetical protein